MGITHLQSYGACQAEERSGWREGCTVFGVMKMEFHSKYRCFWGVSCTFPLRPDVVLTWRCSTFEKATGQTLFDVFSFVFVELRYNHFHMCLFSPRCAVGASTLNLCHGGTVVIMRLFCSRWLNTQKHKAETHHRSLVHAFTLKMQFVSFTGIYCHKIKQNI